jgi:hypothetical protein
MHRIKIKALKRYGTAASGQTDQYIELAQK